MGWTSHRTPLALGTYILMISVQQDMAYGSCIFFLFSIYQMRVSIVVVLSLFYVWYVEGS